MSLPHPKSFGSSDWRVVKLVVPFGFTDALPSSSRMRKNTASSLSYFHFAAQYKLCKK
jgi:hypothetical protein